MVPVEEEKVEPVEPAPEKKDNGYGKRPMWQWVLIYVVIGVVVYGAVYYLFLGKKGGYSANQPQATSTTTTTQGVTVSGTEFAFSPATLTGKVGQAMTVTFKNDGKYPHNFTIADLNVQSKTIQPGESDTVTFTPDKTGTFAFTCTVPGHADKGMTGTLTVE